MSGFNEIIKFCLINISYCGHEIIPTFEIK